MPGHEYVLPPGEFRVKADAKLRAAMRPPRTRAVRAYGAVMSLSRVLLPALDPTIPTASPGDVEAHRAPVEIMADAVQPTQRTAPAGYRL
jgi:hypothetical protein